MNINRINCTYCGTASNTDTEHGFAECPTCHYSAKVSTIHGTVTTFNCNDACMNAGSVTCSCGCGGRNHGINATTTKTIAAKNAKALEEYMEDNPVSDYEIAKDAFITSIIEDNNTYQDAPGMVGQLARMGEAGTIPSLGMFHRGFTEATESGLITWRKERPAFTAPVDGQKVTLELTLKDIDYDTTYYGGVEQTTAKGIFTDAEGRRVYATLPAKLRHSVGTNADLIGSTVTLKGTLTVGQKLTYGTLKRPTVAA